MAVATYKKLWGLLCVGPFYVAGSVVLESICLIMKPSSIIDDQHHFSLPFVLCTYIGTYIVIGADAMDDYFNKAENCITCGV